MGAGKTTIGNHLASILDFDFIDIDKEIEKKTKKSITQIFEEMGEQYFREIESKTLRNIREEKVVIATGGGIVKKKSNRNYILKNGWTVYLNPDFKTIYKRLDSTFTRPLLKNTHKCDDIFKLWQQRHKLYSINHFEINNNLSTSESAELISEFFRYSFMYSCDNIKKTHVLYKKNSMSSLFKIRKTIKSQNTALIIDNKVKALYFKFFSKLNINTLELQAGEKTKSLKTVEKIYLFLKENKIKRTDTVFVAGGGTVTDTACYALSTWQRGVKIFLIPTTLLAMVDASVGGKNGLNYKNTKNMLGNFYQPEIILIDPVFIKTLAKKDYFSGLGECLKYDLLSRKKNLIKYRNPDLLKYLIFKAEITEKDEKDNRGIRCILNLGHTIGHGIEVLTEFKIPHGISVVLGLFFAYSFSFQKNLISHKEFLKFKFNFDLWDLCDEILKIKQIKFKKLLEVVKKDKKNLSKNLSFILPVKVGRKINFSTVEISLEEFKKLWLKSLTYL
ncbi:MAG: bifunctional shikimate kinase/3-dehydroquinate synthase [Candidatus Muiribacteriota bacterium]